MTSVEDLIPHAGTMVLIDRILDWDEETVTCLTGTHRSADNPLRNDSGLPATAGAEYGAQAAALHGGLVGRPANGYFAGLRKFKSEVTYLHDIAANLLIHARCLGASNDAIIYSFEIRDEMEQTERLLISGRVTVALMGAESDDG